MRWRQDQIRYIGKEEWHWNAHRFRVECLVGLIMCLLNIDLTCCMVCRTAATVVATVVGVAVYAITTISSVEFAGGFHVSRGWRACARVDDKQLIARAPSTSPAGARFVSSSSSSSRSKERRAVARPDFSAPPVADRGRPANRFPAVAAVYIM